MSYQSLIAEILGTDDRPTLELVEELMRADRTALDGLVRLLLTQSHQRVVIAGGPRSGKSHLAAKLLRNGQRLHDGEELTGVEWSAGSELFSRWLDEPGPYICENVAAARGLRKWLLRNPLGGLPADLFIQLDTQVDTRAPGQEAMAKGCRTVWDEIEPGLVRRGAKILRARNL